MKKITILITVLCLTLLAQASWAESLHKANDLDIWGAAPDMQGNWNIRGKGTYFFTDNLAGAFSIELAYPTTTYHFKNTNFDLEYHQAFSPNVSGYIFAGFTLQEQRTGANVSAGQFVEVNGPTFMNYGIGLEYKFADRWSAFIDGTYYSDPNPAGYNFTTALGIHYQITNLSKLFQ